MNLCVGYNEETSCLHVCVVFGHYSFSSCVVLRCVRCPETCCFFFSTPFCFTFNSAATKVPVGSFSTNTTSEPYGNISGHMRRTSRSSRGRFRHESSPTSPVEAMQKLLNVHNNRRRSAQCPLLSGLQRRNEKCLTLQAWKCLGKLSRKAACRLEITYRHLHTLSYASDNSIAEDQIHIDSLP